MKTRNVYLGIGFHTGVRATAIERAIRKFLVELDIDQKEVRGLCTVDFKNTEPLRAVSANLGTPVLFFSRDEINSVNVQSKSAAMAAFNLKGIAEPCAILGATRNNGRVRFVKRKSFDRAITLAVVS